MSLLRRRRRQVQERQASGRWCAFLVIDVVVSDVFNAYLLQAVTRKFEAPKWLRIKFNNLDGSGVF